MQPVTRPMTQIARQPIIWQANQSLSRPRSLSPNQYYRKKGSQLSSKLISSPAGHAAFHSTNNTKIQAAKHLASQLTTQQAVQPVTPPLRQKTSQPVNQLAMQAVTQPASLQISVKKTEIKPCNLTGCINNTHSSNTRNLASKSTWWRAYSAPYHLTNTIDL